MIPFRKILTGLLKAPVHGYRWFISPLTGGSCRHIPSCSGYALEALERHGPVRGLLLGTNRILRCRQGGTFGIDPVPLVWIRRYTPWNTWSGKWKTCNRLKRY